MVSFHSPHTQTAHTDSINPGDLHAKTMQVSDKLVAVTELRSLGHAITSSSTPPPHSQSTPLPTRLMERKASLTNGNPFHQACDMELSSEALPHVRSSNLL